MRIINVNIKRFRSILDLSLNIGKDTNFISICGQNNTGKTNVLKALRLFFKPEKYIAEEDCPYYKYYGTRGGSVFPNITVTFENDHGYIYTITRNFDINGLKETKGHKVLGNAKKNRINLTKEECIEHLKHIKFYFIESINISIPELITDLIEDLFDVEYGKSVFRGAKADLKTAFDKYVNGLNKVLKELSSDITPMFSEFNKGWEISFNLEADIKKFRDLISTDIDFEILDGSKNKIDSKGSGLQRLAFILLNIRIIQKLSNKSIIFMIDEPDVFLHQGLQKKLKEYLNTLSSNSQIFVTTHSKIFIDTYKLKNVFLLELDVSKMDSARKKQTITVLKTINIPIEEDTGTQKIKKYLGIEDDKEESLQPYNIIVEGYSDKKYITQLMKYFGVDVPNIICVNGADNVVMYINYYESLYKQMRKRPKTLILLDNDTKGREIFRKIEKNKDKYTNININVSFVPNFLGEMQDGTKLEKVQTNNEIEDFIYPSIICYLINNILKKKCMNCINERNIVNKISKDSFKYKGILDLCEYEKNDKNLERGNEIVFTISNQATESFKTSMANMFNVESNPKIIRILEEQDKKYPEVKNFIKKISKSF